MSILRALRTPLIIASTLAAVSAGIAVAPSASAAQGSLTGRSWYGLPTTMTITVPQVYSGVPVTLTATLSNTVVTGGVQFWANDPAYGLGPIVRAGNGSATFTFMPGPDGVNQWQTFGATFWPDINQGTTEAAAPTITMRVLPNTGPDTFTLSPDPQPLAKGTSRPLAIRTASGATAAVITQGQCTLSNGVLTATGSSGTCSVFASSPGANSYLASSSSWPIALIPAPKKPATKPRPAHTHR